MNSKRPSSSGLRVDLFLKRTRLVKRRSLAATLCGSGYVIVNGRQAPPGKSVHEGDRVEITYARKKVLVEVTGIPGKSGKDRDCYRITREEVIEDDLF